MDIPKPKDPEDHWNLDKWLAKTIAGAIRQDLDIASGIPFGMTQKEWDDVRERIAQGFELYAADPSDDHLLDESLDLFKQNFHGLWF